MRTLNRRFLRRGRLLFRSALPCAGWPHEIEGPIQPAATPKRASVRGRLADRTQDLTASLARARPPTSLARRLLSCPPRFAAPLRWPRSSCTSCRRTPGFSQRTWCCHFAVGSLHAPSRCSSHVDIRSKSAGHHLAAWRQPAHLCLLHCLHSVFARTPLWELTVDARLAHTRGSLREFLRVGLLGYPFRPHWSRNKKQLGFHANWSSWLNWVLIWARQSTSSSR
jgi:hypothetical protein